MKLDLDRGALVDLLKGGFGQSVVAEAAADVAGNVNAPDVHSDGPIRVTTATHEAKFSAAASVSLAHPAGLGIEAKYAPLAKAARAAGLTVTRG